MRLAYSCGKIQESRRKREEGNIAKYKRIYGMNPYTEISLYDCTINTFACNQEETLQIAIDAIGLKQ